MIAERLGITKGALYRHFESKQAIFDAIWNRMLALDGERAAEDSVPQKTYEEDAESYQDVICAGPVKYTADIFETMRQEGKLSQAALATSSETLAITLKAKFKQIAKINRKKKS